MPADAVPGPFAAALDRELSQALLESMSDGVVACDADGVLILFNRVAREWHGADAARKPAQEWPHLYDLYRADGVTPLPAEDVPLARAFRGETVVDEGMAIAVPGRPVRFVVANGGLIRDEAGRKLGAVVVMRDVSELRRVAAELRRANEELERRVEERTAALRESTRRYRDIFDNVLDGVYLLDVLDGGRFRTVEVNPALERLTGIPRAVSVGKTQEEIVDAATAEAVNAKYRRCVESARPTEEEVALELPAGRRIWHSTLIPARDEHGRVTRIVGISRDVTERRDAERSLALLSFALDNVREAAFLVDEGARFRYVNDAACRALGYDREALLSRAVMDVDPDMSAARWAGHWRDLEESRALLFEGRHRTREGRVFPVEISANYFEYEGQGYNLALAHDITERKRAEEALRERESFIRKVLDSVDEEFIVVDRELHILSANRAFSAAAGLPPEDVVWRSCHEVTGAMGRPCDPSGDACVARRVFETGATQTASQVYVDPGGTRRHAELRAYPVTDAAGAVTSVIETATDVTERRRLEEQLAQSRKMEAVGTLAGGVAHDFNNILTGIIGYAHEVEESLPPGDPRGEPVRQILRASARAAQLTHGLLAFGRKQIIDPRALDLNQVVRHVEQLLRRLIREDIELLITLCPDALVVMADTGQLEQVLMNLATNARDSMPEGGVLSIATSVVHLDDEGAHRYGAAKAGPHVLVSVSDTGTGMDEATRQKVFEPFFTTKEVGKGTGLGLAIVYGIVKQHGGGIDVYSEPGRGTTVKVLLPLVQARVDEPPRPEPREPIVPGTETILVAEDDALVRTMLTSVLRRSGYRVIDAFDGQDALEKLAAHGAELDLVVLDVIMPRKSGREVYDAVRAARPEVRVLFLSGYTADIIHKKGIFEEGLEFASKPISPSELLRRIRGLLDAPRKAAPGPSTPTSQ